MSAVIFPLAADDRDREKSLRARFAQQVQIEVWEGMHHVFQVDVQHLRTSRVALDRAAAFLVEAFSKR